MAKEFFKNLPDTSTPLTAERLNGLLDGEESMGSIIVEDIESKNMLNINNITYSYGGTITISDNSVSIPWVGGSTGEAKFNIIKNKYSSYTLSYDTNTSMSRYAIKCLDSSGNILTNLSLNGFTYNGSYQGYYKDFNTSDVEDTFELPSIVSSFVIGFINNNSAGRSTMIYSNAQLEKGTIATDYVEYKDFTNNDIYSTNEIKIGTWIDGKPLYRKVIRYSGSLTSGSNQIPHGISNLDNIVNKNCFIEFYSGSVKSIYGHGTYIDNTQFISISTINSTNVNLYIGSAWANSFTNGCYIILEYTKTTD